MFTYINIPFPLLRLRQTADDAIYIYLAVDERLSSRDHHSLGQVQFRFVEIKVFKKMTGIFIGSWWKLQKSWEVVELLQIHVLNKSENMNEIKCDGCNHDTESNSITKSKLMIPARKEKTLSDFYAKIVIRGFVERMLCSISSNPFYSILRNQLFFICILKHSLTSANGINTALINSHGFGV